MESLNWIKFRQLEVGREGLQLVFDHLLVKVRASPVSILYGTLRPFLKNTNIVTEENLWVHSSKCS